MMDEGDELYLADEELDPKLVANQEALKLLSAQEQMGHFHESDSEQ
jgi:hypothetical protein